MRNETPSRMVNDGDIVIPKDVAQGLASLDQDDLGVFLQQLLYCTGYSEAEAKFDHNSIGGMTAFLVLRPLLKRVNGFDDPE